MKKEVEDLLSEQILFPTQKTRDWFDTDVCAEVALHWKEKMKSGPILFVRFYTMYPLNRETSFQLPLCTYNVPEMTL